MKAGCELTTSIFMLLENQIFDEKQLEDINNLLNSYDVPNI